MDPGGIRVDLGPSGTRVGLGGTRMGPGPGATHEDLDGLRWKNMGGGALLSAMSCDTVHHLQHLCLSLQTQVLEAGLACRILQQVF